MTIKENIFFALTTLCFLWVFLKGGELHDLCTHELRIEITNKENANVAQNPDGSIVLCDYCKSPATIFVMACTEISKFCTKHSHLSKKK